LGTSTNKIALTYRDQELYGKAAELGKQVINTHTRVLGKEHPDTLTSINNLALTYRYDVKNGKIKQRSWASK